MGMGALGRAMGKALTAGAPIVEKSWEMEMRDAEAARMREWQGGEYAKNREQVADIHSQDMALDKDKLAVTEKGVDAEIRQGDERIGLEGQRVGLEGERLGLAKEEQGKALQLIDEQITRFKNENQDTTDIRNLRNELKTVDPADTAKVQSIMQSLKARGVKMDDDFKFFKMTDYGSDGYISGQSLYRTDNSTGRAERVDTGGTTTAGGGADAGASGYDYQTLFDGLKERNAGKYTDAQIQEYIKQKYGLKP